MKKLALLIVALIGFQIASPTAEARRHWAMEGDASNQISEREADRGGQVRRQARERGATRSRTTRSRRDTGDSSFSSAGSLTGGSGLGPRPGKWCGWWMRTQLGGGPAYNLAWNWSRYGSATSPQVGAVVVWRHHVGIITGQASNGQWIVKSGNDGGRVRERARSVSGAVFRI